MGDCTPGGDAKVASSVGPFDAVMAAHGGDFRYPFSGVLSLLQDDAYHDRRIVYSLGNFVLGGNVNPADKEAIISRASFTLTDGKIAPSGEEVVPVRVTTAPERNDFRPIVLAGEARDRPLARLATYSEGLDGAKIRNKALRPR